MVRVCVQGEKAVKAEDVRKIVSAETEQALAKHTQHVSPLSLPLCLCLSFCRYLWIFALSRTAPPPISSASRSPPQLYSARLQHLLSLPLCLICTLPPLAAPGLTCWGGAGAAGRLSAGETRCHDPLPLWPRPPPPGLSFPPSLPLARVMWECGAPSLAPRSHPIPSPALPLLLRLCLALLPPSLRHRVSLVLILTHALARATALVVAGAASAGSV